MEKTLQSHKTELQQHASAYQNRIKKQVGVTKSNSVSIGKMALIGGASAYVGLKVIGFALRKIKGKKNSQPQIIYVQPQEQEHAIPKKTSKVKAKKSFWKGIAASIWASLLPLATSYAKKEGAKIVEQRAKKVMEKYKSQIPMDKLEKLGLDKLFKP